MLHKICEGHGQGDEGCHPANPLPPRGKLEGVGGPWPLTRLAAYGPYRSSPRIRRMARYVIRWIELPAIIAALDGGTIPSRFPTHSIRG